MKQSRPPATSASPGAAASSLSPTLRILLGLAAAVIALAGVSYARDLIGPLAISYFFELIRMYRAEYLDGDSDAPVATVS